MDLAWLAAVLQSRDIAPHPNFPDDGYDASGPARLAAALIGDRWRSHRIAELKPGDLGDDDPVALIQQCLRSDTLAESVAELRAMLTGPKLEDMACATALSLIACSSAAEMDDYSTCFAILDVQLRRTSDIENPDSAFLHAALLQQRALRLRDAGEPYLELSREAAGILNPLEVERCGRFATSPGISWSSITTLREIKDGLLAAITSQGPIESDERLASGLPTWQDVVRRPPPSLAVRVAQERADIYANYVEQVFAARFGSQTHTFGGTAPADLFYAILPLELAGHAGVYAARKDLAILRLIQYAGDVVQTADALRLLRHAAAKKELDLVLQRLHAAGPLSAISVDARQILRTRMSPELLRTVEMRVLRIAAELLAPAEARAALDGVLNSLSSGGPPDLPGQWEILVLRKEVAWMAAAALGNACGAAGEVAEMLQEEIRSQDTAEDQLFDRAMLRAVGVLDWTTVPTALQESWRIVLDDRASSLPGTVEVAYTRMGRPVPAPVSTKTIDRLIHHLNEAMRSERTDSTLVEEGVPFVREVMDRIRSDAAHGSYSMGGPSVGDIAAGLIIVAGAHELWPDLTGFLLDRNVQREDRTPAFERLARTTMLLPEEVAASYRDGGQQLLVSLDLSLFGSQLVPYPAALRFLAAHRLLSDADVYDGVATLAGSEHVDGRREAAATVSVLAASDNRQDLLALALSLARDKDMEVRANAAHALSILARPGQRLATPAQRRLEELLNEDGLLAPLRVLQSLEDEPQQLAPTIWGSIEDIASNHPSRLVRQEAGRVLGRGTNHVREDR